MTSTKEIEKQVKAIRKEMMKDLFSALQESKYGKIRFTDTQAPRFYFDGKWREIIMLKQGFFAGADSILFGWHDERCTSNGANTFMGVASLTTETLLQCHELVFGNKE